MFFDLLILIASIDRERSLIIKTNKIRHTHKLGGYFFQVNILRIRKIIQGLSLFLILSGQLYSQSTTAQQTDLGSPIIPGPVPFSLDARSVVYCINLLNNNRFLEINNKTGVSKTIEVHRVWSLFLGVDENYPEGHQRRYDIIINEVPLNWDNSFIAYGGELLNLRLLFLYKNQYPPQGLEYRITP